VRVPPEAAKQPPTVQVKWYDWLRWLLDRVDGFPKNQRFIFGTRLADRAIGVLELLLEAAYSSEKQHLLTQANREIEVLRWLVRLAKDRKLLTERYYLVSCKALPAVPGGQAKKKARAAVSSIAEKSGTSRSTEAIPTCERLRPAMASWKSTSPRR
jgi:hypothetical protein